mmetsp:Transcript_53622/g.124901  ORF Transcript_53622/g.124901 Transcript_53622/m.124901 type:complete len:209 (-) Transcript_53622:42-668(-)
MQSGAEIGTVGTYRGASVALVLLALVIFFLLRRRVKPAGKAWRPLPATSSLEVSLRPRRIVKAVVPTRGGLDIANQFGALASPVATPPPSPRLAARLPPAAGPVEADATPFDTWTKVQYSRRKKAAKELPLGEGAQCAPPEPTVGGAINEDAIDLYYAQKDVFVRGWTREAKQARSVKQKKRVDYQVEKRRLQSQHDRAAQVQHEDSE